MFDAVARRYDLTNTLLSFGQDRRWRRRTRRALALVPGERVLDVAAGTGVSSAELARSGALAVASDFSLGMLTAGSRRRPQLPFVAADALQLRHAASAAAVGVGALRADERAGKRRERRRSAPFGAARR